MGMRWEPHKRLTEREWEVWKRIATGMSNIEITKDFAGIEDYSLAQIEYSVMCLYDKLSIPDGSARRVKLALIFPMRS